MLPPSPPPPSPQTLPLPLVRRAAADLTWCWHSMFVRRMFTIKLDSKPRSLELPADCLSVADAVSYVKGQLGVAWAEACPGPDGQCIARFNTRLSELVGLRDIGELCGVSAVTGTRHLPHSRAVLALRLAGCHLFPVLPARPHRAREEAPVPVRQGLAVGRHCG